ncbi:MAG: discoidin domain-containing protein, partial [Bacteroidota bacterium]
TNLKFNDIPISVHNRFEIGLSDAMGLPISASSVKDSLPENAISNANDVDFNSAWVSQNLSSQTQSEWIEIDLLEERQISAVKLSWVLLGHARSYTIEVSPDKANWTRIHEEQNGNGLNDIIDRLDSAFGRYVRINMNRAVLFNYALQNFEVYCPEITCLNSQAPVGLSSVLQDAERIQVFPNPYSDRLYIEVLDGVRYDHLKIFDLSGKEVFASPFQEMLRPELKPGVYFLQVVGSQGSQVVKVVQQ